MAQHASSSPSAPPLEHLTGSVERVVFHNPETGFCVLRVKAQGRQHLAAVVGTTPTTITPGEYVDCEGTWITHRTYGVQFHVTQLRILPPNSLEGVERYLSSGLIKGIGPHFAHTLVQAFGTAVFTIIAQQPEQLQTLAGIGPKRTAQVVKAWADQQAIHAIMVFLHSHGIGTARAVRIYKTYGAEAMTRVQEDPYRLALDIPGIGFQTADLLAQRLGMPRDAMPRAQAGIRHVLQTHAEDGHCAMVYREFIEAAKALLDIPDLILAQAITLEFEAKRLMIETIHSQPCLVLASLHRAEVHVATQLVRLLEGPPPWGQLDLETVLPHVEAQTGYLLAPSQRYAVARALAEKVTIITGGPGVGKTTIVRSILQALGSQQLRILLGAPTGRAAKRLSEATGMEAKTIHRLLAFDPHSAGFVHGANNPLSADVVIIDEVSMVDVVLMAQLLRAIPPHAAVLLVGDADQLPSVGPGTVLADILAADCVPTVTLTEIFRQAAPSQILVNAHRIKQGQMPLLPAEEDTSDWYLIPAETPEDIQTTLLQMVTQQIPQSFGWDPLREVQVLTPMNRGSLGARALNAQLQAALNPSTSPSVTRFGWTYTPGDKVMQTRNNYDKDVYNGDMGYVVSVDVEANEVVVDFEGRQLVYDVAELDEMALAYAITIHKSQGSEYPAVVIPFATQHYPMLARNLLYTGVTRGKRLVVLIGQERALTLALRNTQTLRRLTNLTARLRSVSAP